MASFEAFQRKRQLPERLLPCAENIAKSQLVYWYDQLFWQRCAVNSERDEVKEHLTGYRFLSDETKQAVLQEYEVLAAELTRKLGEVSFWLNSGGEETPWII